MSNLLNFKFGKYTNLPATRTAGTVYVTTDNHAMYIDLPESHEENATVSRLRIGDINVYQSSSDVNFKPPYQEGFYYFIGDNALMRYDGTAWTQINTTADIEGELDAIEARVDSLEEDLAAEIKRSTEKDAEHSKDISDLKVAVSERVTTTEFNTFKQSNTEAINGAKSLAQEAQGAAGAAQSTADDALERANDAYGLAETKTTLDEVKGLGYATTSQAQNYANAVLGTSTDASSKNTVFGAKKAAAEALSAANAAQDTVDTLADNVLLLNGTKAMTGNLSMNSHKITGLLDPTEKTDAATKQYVDNSIAANDAMTFIGTVGEGGDVASLPATANKGDTYKVNSIGTYSGIAAKVGDLFINKGEDGATANWSHISSGYEDDYLQKIISEGNVLYLTDGVNLTSTGGVSNFTVIGDENSNLQFTVSSTDNSHTITGSMVWGTF